MTSVKGACHTNPDDLTQPVIDPEVRQDIPHRQIRPPIVVSNQKEHPRDNRETQVTEQDQFTVLDLVQRTRRIEMVHSSSKTVSFALPPSFRLSFMTVVAGHIHEQVQGPSHELLSYHRDGGRNRRFFRELRQLVRVISHSGRVHLSSFGDEHHVAFQMPGGLVMFAVGDLPGEIWDEQCRMAYPTDRIVERFEWGEGLMTALMSHHPQSGAKESLHERVEAPQNGTQRDGRDIDRDEIGVKEIKGRGKRANISGDIPQATRCGTLETVCWDDVPDLLDGEIGDLKFVSICV